MLPHDEDVQGTSPVGAAHPEPGTIEHALVNAHEEKRRLKVVVRAIGRVLARLDTLVGRTTAGSGTMGRALSDPSLYANADSLVTELRALVADVKARPGRYVHIRLF